MCAKGFEHAVADGQIGGARKLAVESFLHAVSFEAGNLTGDEFARELKGGLEDAQARGAAYVERFDFDVRRDASAAVEDATGGSRNR